MSDNAKLIAEARAIPMPFEEPEELVLLDELADALEAANGKIQQIKGALADYLMDDEADEVDALRGISNILTDA